MWRLRRKIDCIIKHRVFGMNTSKRGALVRRTDSPLGFTRQSYLALTCMNLEGKRSEPPLAPALGQWVITHRRGSWVPTPETNIPATHLITPYTARPSDRLDPVGRIYAGGALSTLCGWRQVCRATAHKVTDTKRDYRQSGSKVTGRFARQLVHLYLQRLVESDGGNYAQ